MICEGCGGEFNVLYMCDQCEDMLCGSCFEKTDCGSGLHEEGCETMVISSNGEEPSGFAAYGETINVS